MSGRTTYMMSAKGRKRGARPRTQQPRTSDYGRESFRLTCRRVRGPVALPTITLDPLATAFDWTRAGAVMTGSLSLTDATLRTQPGLVQKGDVVRCEVRTRPGGAWTPLWEMTVSKPLRAIADGTSELQMRSRLEPAQKTRDNWRFRTGKARPNGWTADEITRAACAKYRVRIGELPRGRHRIKKLIDKSASVVEIVTAAWREEREATGRRFDVSIARGLVDVREVRRPRYMLLLGPALLDAVLEEGISPRFATAVVVTSTAKRRGSAKRRKIRTLVVDRARVRRYGYIRRHVEKAGLSSVAEARRFGRRWLARTAQPWAKVTLTHAGVPWVGRGDGVRLNLPDELLTADVYLLAATHRVGYGDYTMELQATVTDPFASDERAARVKRRKAAAARRRQRKAPARRDRLTPKKAAVRS